MEMKYRLSVLIAFAVLVMGLSFTTALAATSEEDTSYTEEFTKKRISEESLDMPLDGETELGTASELPQLSTPMNLLWGKQWGDEDDSGAKLDDGQVINAPAGFIYFEVVEAEGSYQGRYELSVYRVGEDKPVLNTKVNDDYAEKGMYRISNVLFIENANELESGTYFFTVKLLGDGIHYSDGDIARSGTWTWTKPTKKYPTPVNLAWKYPGVSFTYAEGSYGAPAFKYIFSETDDPTAGKKCGLDYVIPHYEFLHYSDGTAVSRDGDGDFFNDDYYGYHSIQRYGNGFYYFQVRNLSYDITNYLHSDWSDFSEPYNLTTLLNETRDILNNIDQTDKGTIRQNVESVGTARLRTAMSADHDGTDAVKKIEELEKAYAGGPADIDVGAAVKEMFEDNNTSIIGANLNGDGNAVLSFDTAQNKQDISPVYKENAVMFSMALNGVDDPENLKVPVQLVIPIPANMNPEFFRILHFKTNGDTDVIYPYIFTKDGKKYAKFAITSFSDFAFAEEVKSENNEENKENEPDNKETEKEGENEKKEVNKDNNNTASGADAQGNNPSFYTVTASSMGYSITLSMNETVPNTKKKKDVVNHLNVSLTAMKSDGTKSNISIKKIKATKPKNGTSKVTVKLKGGNKEEKKAVKSLNKSCKKLPIKVAVS